MDGSASLSVEDDQGTRPNSPVSVEGGQASHAPPMSELEQVVGGTMGILQQLAQALQRAEQPAAITPKRSTIERIARYRPVDFKGRKRMSLQWQKISSREPSECLCKCIAQLKRSWNVRPHYYKMRLISGGFP